MAGLKVTEERLLTPNQQLENQELALEDLNGPKNVIWIPPLDTRGDKTF